jgi:predicted ATPase/DNA-binding CsgD family transcriptional regulator
MRRTDPASAGTLPVEVTSFVGRRHERGELKRLLGGSRLVTLTGVGGTGKTRLATRAGSELRRTFPDGVWFVELTALPVPELSVVEVEDPQLLAYLVMDALGLRDQPRIGSPAEQLVRHLAGLRALLVLDNCEYRPSACAVLADTLLRGCPGLKILATSREPLLAAAEAIFQVPPLPLPGSGANLAGVERFEAVALFAARARAVAPGFAVTGGNAPVVAELCRRLDGLPLAIELAAAWVRVLMPGQILERLTERFGLLSRGNRMAPQRQQTLRASVEWSFELCAKPERLLWARVSVFVGGCELDAVEGVCADAELSAAELPGVLAGLLVKSILIRDDAESGTPRYRMLETLRDYGLERLTALGEQFELRRRHRDWLNDLARRFEANLIGPRQLAWFARLDRELPNIRAAMQFSQGDPDDAEACLTAATSLYRYWIARGLHREGRAWLEQALARPAGPTMTRVKAWFAHTVLAGMQGDPTAASTSAQHAREVAAELGEPLAHAIAAAADGSLAQFRGDLASAARHYQRGVDGLAAEQADEHLLWRLSALSGLAITRAMLGDLAGAAACHETTLAICQPHGESWYSGQSLCFLGIGLWRQGDFEAATARLMDALRHLHRVNETHSTSWCLDVLAWIASDQGRPDRSATLLGAADRLAQVMGAPVGLLPELAAQHEQYQQRTRDALGEQAYRAAFTRGGEMHLDEAVAHALDEPWRPPAPAPVPAPGATSIPLTRRERQVADLVAQGLSNKEIAARLVISRRTAESHVENILTKLGCSGRAQVAAWTAARQSPTGAPPPGRPAPPG